MEKYKEAQLIQHISEHFKSELGYCRYIGIFNKPYKDAKPQQSELENFGIEYIYQKSGVCEDDYYGFIDLPYYTKYLRFQFQC